MLNKPNNFCTSKEFRDLTQRDWDNSGKPYEQTEQLKIVELFAAGKSIAEICESSQRPPSGVVKQLRGFVVKGEGSNYDNNYAVTQRGITLRRDWADTATQRSKLSKQSEASMQAEDAVRVAPVPPPEEELPSGFEDEPAPLLKKAEAIWPFCQNQSEGRGLRKPRPASVGYMVESGDFVKMPLARKGLTSNMEPQSLEITLESFNNVKSVSEKIMNASVKLETRVYLNGKPVTNYSESDIVDLLIAQEAKIKFLKEMTAEQSTRRDELVAQAVKDRDTLLALLDTRAKNGKTALEVAATVTASEEPASGDSAEKAE